MTHRSRYVSVVALLGLSSALSPVLAAAQQSQSAAYHSTADAARQPIANIPSTTDAPVAADRLLQAFQDKSSLTRVQSLEQIDASPAIAPETIVATLLEALHDRDPLVREAALRALLHRDTEQTPVLNQADLVAFQGETAELARVHFAQKSADASTLKELMQHGTATVQQSAFEALAALDLSAAVEALRAELQDTQSIYRLQTLQLLTRNSFTLPSKELLTILQEAAADHDPLVRAFANQTLKDKQREAEGNPAN